MDKQIRERGEISKGDKEMRRLLMSLMIVTFVLSVSLANAGINHNQNNLTNVNQIRNRNVNKNLNANVNSNRNANLNCNKNTNLNANRNINRNISINKNSNKQNQAQGQLQGQNQGQGQGQVAVGSVGTEVSNSVSVAGDNSSYKSYSFSPPALNAEKGSSPLNAYSIFGGIGVSSTEQYVVSIETLAVIERMEKLGYLSKAEARKEARKVFKQLKKTTSPKKLLGILWETRGRHILNGLGLLSW